MECGLIGEKLRHSFSPRIHAALADYDYKLVELTPQELAPFIRERTFRGVNVTIPYKKAIIPLCDSVSQEAQEIGSVNTLVNRDGVLTGYNTDIDGFLYLAQRTGIHFSGKKVLVLGSGGTSLTACAAARRERAKEIVVVSRNGDVNYQHLDAHADADIVVNTTPVGMYPNNGGKLIDLSAFPQCEGVLDVIYNPLRTPLVLDAQMRGIPAAGGLAMLVGQAAEAARLFADCKITEERVAAVVEQLEKEFTNIILVGMPGCGKSSVGRKVAELLNRPFLDTDLEIEKKYGSVPALIEREGENYFREVESEILAELTKRTGVVIATGGGAVLRTENHLLMRQNGKVFFLERNIDLLETKGRPLSKNLSILYQKRLPCYLACSDVQIQNDEITNAAQQIAQLFS